MEKDKTCYLAVNRRFYTVYGVPKEESTFLLQKHILVKQQSSRRRDCKFW